MYGFYYIFGIFVIIFKNGIDFSLILWYNQCSIMDIKEKIEELVDKVKNDKDFAKDFKDNPVKAVEGVIGVDLPDDKLESIVDGVKAKVSLDDIKDKIGGLFGKK